MPDGTKKRRATSRPYRHPDFRPDVEVGAEVREQSDAELNEALAATQNVHAHILPPRAVHDELRERAVAESAFPVDGRIVRISKGELLAFMWRYFQEHYGPPTGEVARFVARLRDEYEQRETEAVRRGLYSSPFTDNRDEDDATIVAPRPSGGDE